jgi:hypothetical protein
MLSREVFTIPDLWRMWTMGREGMPSVEALDAQWGSGGRQVSADRQYYSMRKVLVKEIKVRTAKGEGDRARVVEESEGKRQSPRNHWIWSLRP